jgi:hypothetical protein
VNVTNRVLGLLLGLSLVAVGVLAVIEPVIAALGRPGWLVERQRWDGVFRQLTWEDPGLVLTAVVLVLVGLALLTVQLWPALPAALHVERRDPDRLVAIEGGGVQELLRRRAADDEDVLGAKARLRRRRVRITVRVPPDADRKAVRARVRQAARSHIQALQLDKPLRPRVRVRRDKRRVR